MEIKRGRFSVRGLKASIYFVSFAWCLIILREILHFGEENRGNSASLNYCDVKHVTLDVEFRQGRKHICISRQLHLFLENWCPPRDFGAEKYINHLFHC
ncbi:hypothetical protein Ancab_016614 [Ancistrocladus abbreviatus]